MNHPLDYARPEQRPSRLPGPERPGDLWAAVIIGATVSVIAIATIVRPAWVGPSVGCCCGLFANPMLALLSLPMAFGSDGPPRLRTAARWLSVIAGVTTTLLWLVATGAVSIRR